MLGGMKVVSTNLKCDKQSDGNYLYEYSVQVYPKEEDEDLAGESVGKLYKAVSPKLFTGLSQPSSGRTRTHR